MSLGISSLTASCWVLTHLCVGRVVESCEDASTVYQVQTDQELVV